MAAVTSLSALSGPGSLPGGDALAIAAFSPALLWISTANELAYTLSAGRSWTRVAAVNPQGATGIFDVLSSAGAWLLAPGTGLWHTADGIHWTQAGPVFSS